MKSIILIKKRIDSINEEITALEKRIEIENGFSICLELKKELTHKIELRNAYQWVLKD